MSNQESLRAEVDSLRAEIAEETARQRAARSKATEDYQVGALTNQRDALKAELAALKGHAPTTPAPAKAPAKAAAPTSAEPGDDDA